MNPPIDHKDDWWLRQFSMRGWRWENRHGDNERIAQSSLPPYSSTAFLQSRGLLVKLHLCRCINKKLIVMHFDYFYHSDERKRERLCSCQIFPYSLIFTPCFKSSMKFRAVIASNKPVLFGSYLEVTASACLFLYLYIFNLLVWTVRDLQCGICLFTFANVVTTYINRVQIEMHNILEAYFTLLHLLH